MLNESLDSYIKENQQKVIELAIALSRIPSPTGNEKNKAEYIRNWLDGIGSCDVCTDEAGNVICTCGNGGNEPVSIYAAHIDTVFNDIKNINPIVKDGRIYAPSIQDNSINAAALMYFVRYLDESGWKPGANLMFAFDTGEEGTGNLKGMRHIFDKLKYEAKEVVAVDLGYNTVINKAVGSKRYSVNITTPGGHSWKDFGNDNAIFHAASIIGKLYAIKPANEPRTTYNAGMIRGGTSINTIAPGAEILIDLRSESSESLICLEKKFLKILDETVNDKVKIDCHLIGERPCGSINEENRLMKRITRVMKGLDIEMHPASGSTDANIPISMGIPAVSFGVCNGGGAHTANEYIETDTLEKGLKLLYYFIVNGFGE